MDAASLARIGRSLGVSPKRSDGAKRGLAVSVGDEAEAVEALLLSPKRAPPSKRRRTDLEATDMPVELKDLLQKVSTKVLGKLESLRQGSSNNGISSNSSTSSSSSLGNCSFNSEVVASQVSQQVLNQAKSGELPSVEQWRLKALVEERARDTLSVLLATGAIVRPKEKRDDGSDMLWVGLPGNSKRELSQLQRERSALVRSIDKKHRYLQELIVQSIAMENLAKRNKERVDSPPAGERIPLPFIMVSTDKDTVIECEMAEDQSDIFFNFNKPFDLHDDGEVLRRMNLTKANESFLKSILPENLLPFVPSDVIEKQE